MMKRHIQYYTPLCYLCLECENIPVVAYKLGMSYLCFLEEREKRKEKGAWP